MSTYHFFLMVAVFCAHFRVAVVAHLIGGGRGNVFYSGSQVSSMTKISGLVLSRICGCVTVAVDSESVDIGLGLKYSRRELYLPGYVRRVSKGRDRGNFFWEYSDRVVQMLRSFKESFPALFAGLEAHPDMKEYQLETLFVVEDGLAATGHGDPKAQLVEVQNWLGALETAALALCPCDSTTLELASIRRIENMAAELPSVSYTHSAANVPLSALLKPIAVPMIRPSGPVQWQLGHRVVNVRASGPVPFGARVRYLTRKLYFIFLTVFSIAPRCLQGTVISLFDNRAEVVFDRAFLAGNDFDGRLNNFCGAVVPLWSLVNLSAGEFKVVRAPPASTR